MNVLKPNKQTTIATLQQQRCSQHEIERVTGIDRKTIRSYQRRFEAESANSPTPATGSGAVEHLGVRPLARVHRSPGAPEAQRHGGVPGPGGPPRIWPPLQQRQALHARCSGSKVSYFLDSSTLTRFELLTVVSRGLSARAWAEVTVNRLVEAATSELGLEHQPKRRARPPAKGRLSNRP